MNKYYIFESCQIILGPYDSYQEAKIDMNLHIDELYLLDYYPKPYVDFIPDEDETQAYAKRERIIKRKER